MVTCSGAIAALFAPGRRYTASALVSDLAWLFGAGFAPLVALVLSAQFGRVSNERLVCGPGLVNIHRALCQIAGVDPGLPTPRDISERAAAGDALGMRAVDVFCAVFGAIAGDLVLTLGAWDGVFLTGGLVPRMLDSLRHSGFRQRFEAKGRFSPNMAQVPSLAVMHPQAGLLGAAAWAADLLEREAT